MWLYQMTLRLILFLITVNFTWTRTATLINLGQGRCGEETELVCSGTGTFTWNIRKDSIIVADPAQLHDDIKYSVSVTSTSVTLTIHNTDVSDLGEYSCEVAYDGRSEHKQLQFECQANATLASVTSGKRLQLTVDKLFPASVSAVLSVNAMGGGASSVPSQVSRFCKNSNTYRNYTICKWTSSSLPDGQYTYSIVVSTPTSTTRTGTFEMYTPGAPQLANSITEESKLILRVDEGKPATVSCTSSGGYPVQTVLLYLDNSLQASSNTGALQNGLYTVNVSYTILSSRSQDLKKICCNSSYPDADDGLKGQGGTCATLQLFLPPSQVSASQDGDVVSGNSIRVHCTATGSRPAAGLSWAYMGTTSTPQVSTSVDGTTYLYTAVSNYTGTVTAADNGQTITCLAAHRLLPQPLMANTTLNLLFEPSGISLTGNTDGFQATGNNRLAMSCTTGSANPPSIITWHNGTASDQVISNNHPYVNTTGQYNGVVRQQKLWMYPTRYNDGQSVTCSATNNIGSVKSTTVSLNLHYSPILSFMTDRTIQEGDKNVALKCQAWSKPAATFRWYKGGSSVVLHQVNGTSDDNSGTYVIRLVSRQDTGRYECRAENGVGSADSKYVNLIVEFPALTTTITGATGIYANGVNKVTLTCSTGSSNPASIINWFRNNQTITSNESLVNMSGEYGGKLTSQVIKFVPTHKMDGHVMECRAGNGLQSSTAEWAREKLDLKYNPIVSVNIAPVEIDETQSGSLSCTVDSKPLSTITWSRFDSGNTVPTNRLVKGSNSLGYMITDAQREDAGDYRCTAYNGYGGNKFNNTQVVIRYSPDVGVVTQNTTVNAPSVVIRCNPSGVPATYTYTSWKQVWPGYGVVRTFSGSDVLTLTSLTYKDNGVYTCEVENGARYSRNPSAGQGQALLNILSYPVIMTVETTMTVAVQIGNVSEFSVDFFSNTQDIKVYIVKENSESKSNIASTSILPKRLTYRVFDHNIEVGGFVVRTMLTVKKEEELGSYKLTIENNIGSQNLTVILKPKGPPFAPTIISMTNIQQTSAVLTWTRGFHGGFSQTVYVEISVDRQRWDVKFETYEGKLENKTKVNTILQQLQPGTLYFIRMFAENEMGKSGWTRTFNITTTMTVYTASPVPVVGGVIGGCLGAIVVIAVIVVIFQRNYTFNISKKREAPAGPFITESENPGYDAGRPYEDVSMTTATSDYAALGNVDTGPENVHVYSSLDTSNRKPHPVYENFEKRTNEDLVCNNAVQKSPVETVLN
ncbi:synaptogenesis protein syg-2-like isoform X2 [Mya arenaria]|uniref:synaptogenesis protein syg-2-like isoform X2 n=1 Tax=Mya arenaria TaxID=6604 RepID=UPI0022DF4C64|nr:synaptogenesis protein syg-2-like isoform X2 [Mya arenaria]